MAPSQQVLIASFTYLERSNLYRLSPQPPPASCRIQSGTNMLHGVAATEVWVSPVRITDAPRGIVHLSPQRMQS